MSHIRVPQNRVIFISADGYRSADKLLHTYAYDNVYHEGNNHNWSGDDQFVVPYLLGFISGVVPMAGLCFICIILAYVLGRVWNKTISVNNQNQLKVRDGSEVDYHV